jgi:multisubunit Na+/H+ antiporter MnhG subunit
MFREIVTDVLLGLAVLTVAASSVGLMIMPSAYAKLHYVAPAAVVAPVFVTLAIFAREGLDVSTGETVLMLVFMLFAAPYLSHATIRAIRVRDSGDWRGAGQAVPVREKPAGDRDQP